MVSDLKILVRVLKYLNQCTILCCIKNPVTHTHTHTLRVQTLFSHSDKSPKQTKTETTQQGSHRQKFPRPEVIRCYRNQKTLHETIQPWLTLVNSKYMMVCIYFQEFWSSFFVYFLWTAWTKIFSKCSEKYGSGHKCFGASIEIFEPVYNTMLHQKSSDTHTHTHTLRVQTQLSHSDKPPKQTKTETTQQGSHRQKFPRPEVIRCYRNQKTLHETILPWLTLVNSKYMLVCICIFMNSDLDFLSTFYGQLGPKFSEGNQTFLQMF